VNYVNARAERDLIRHALLNDEKLAELSVKIPPKVFSSDPLVKVYTHILSHFDRYSKRITPSELLSVLERDPLKEDEKDSYFTLAKSLFVDRPPDQDYAFCKDEIIRMWRARSLMNAIKVSGDMIDRGDLFKGEGAIRDVLDEPLFVGAENIHEFELTESVDQVIAQIKDMQDHPDKYWAIPTGIPSLDKHLKGIMLSEVGLIVGKTAGFKSTALYNFAIESYMAGHDTMMVTIEMSGEQILRRLYGRIAHINITELDEAVVSKAELERMRAEVKAYADRKKNKLFIVDVSSGCTVDLLKAKVREYKRRSNLELVVVDYMQIMETRNGDADLYDWKALAIISKKLKETARQFKVGIWTAAQQIAGGQAKKGEDSAEDIAFSKAAGQNVDILLKVTQSPEQEQAHQAEIKVLKIRRKAKCPPILINPDPAFGRIHQG